jgi:hypothetical protein
MNVKQAQMRFIIRFSRCAMCMLMSLAMLASCTNESRNATPIEQKTIDITGCGECASGEARADLCSSGQFDVQDVLVDDPYEVLADRVTVEPPLPCQSNTDCESQLCVVLGELGFCGQWCEDDSGCAQGWSCQLLQSRMDFVAVCWPMTSDRENCDEDARAQ